MPGAGIRATAGRTRLDFTAACDFIGRYQPGFHDATCRFVLTRAERGDTLAFNPVYTLVFGFIAPAGRRATPFAAVADPA